VKNLCVENDFSPAGYIPGNPWCKSLNNCLLWLPDRTFVHYIVIQKVGDIIKAFGQRTGIPAMLPSITG
jgi:hypothetical protein